MRVAIWSSLASSVAFLFLASCLQISTDTGDGTSSGTGGATSGASAPGGGTGVDCVTDPATGVVLCAELSTCPGLSVDPSAFAGCGFRTGGAAIDLECCLLYTSRKPDAKIEARVHAVGLLMLLTLIGFVTYADLISK